MMAWHARNSNDSRICTYLIILKSENDLQHRTFVCTLLLIKVAKSQKAFFIWYRSSKIARIFYVLSLLV